MLTIHLLLFRLLRPLDFALEFASVPLPRKVWVHHLLRCLGAIVIAIPLAGFVQVQSFAVSVTALNEGLRYVNLKDSGI